MAVVLPKLRERLKSLLPEEAEPALTGAGGERVEETRASVAGLGGMLSRPGNCCNPLPGDDLTGFITRGRGVVIHRTDCPNLQHLLAREPERQVPVEWPTFDGKQTLRARVIVEGPDRTGMLRDVTGLIANSKINMSKVESTTNARSQIATITATLELQRPEQLAEILKDLRAVRNVTLAERLVPGMRKGGSEASSNGRRRGHGATSATEQPTAGASKKDHTASRDRTRTPSAKGTHDPKSTHDGRGGPEGRARRRA